MAERRDGKDEGVLARWSRRKQAARAAGHEPPAEPPPPAEADEDAPERRADALAVQAPPELPDPETLDAASDFKPFLRPGVPVEAHRAALRRLWRLDPFYSQHDGLSDYCEDFTDQATTLKGIRTVWKVGRGLLDQVEKAAPAPQKVTAQADPPDDASEAPSEPAPPRRDARVRAKTEPTRRPLPKRV
jgi:hypothetical protein